MSSKCEDSIYNHTDEIILFTACRLKRFKNISEFEQRAKFYIKKYCNIYLEIDVKTNDINNFYTIHSEEIMNIVNNRKQFYKQYDNDDEEDDIQSDLNPNEYYSDELEIKVDRIISYRKSINKAKKLLLKKINKAKKLSFERVRKLKTFQTLEDKDISNIYEEYSKEWDAIHEQDIIKNISKKDSISDALKKCVIMHANDDLLTKEAFEQKIQEWNRGSKSLDDCYEIYKDLYFKQPSSTIQYTETENTRLIGYKSPDKIKALKRLYPRRKVVDNTVKASFDLKSNIKNYQLHKCASRNTWIIDLMFCGKLCYLVAINVNTKYLYVELINDIINQNKFSKKGSKSTFKYLRALEKMICSGMKVRHLIGDGEMAFNSKEAKETFYNSKGIDFKPVPRQVMGVYPDFMKKEQKAVKTDPLHGSLGIIDRVIRTIRDIAYNMKIGIITPKIMYDIVKQYNNSPHKGLSKWAGFSVTPKMVNDDPDLETYIVRRICQENYNVMNRPGFKIKAGTNVKVYNEKDSMSKRRSIIQPGSFKVNGFKNGLYEVEGNVNGKNKIQRIPRYKLEFI